MNSNRVPNLSKIGRIKNIWLTRFDDDEKGRSLIPTHSEKFNAGNEKGVDLIDTLKVNFKSNGIIFRIQ